MTVPACTPASSALVSKHPAALAPVAMQKPGGGQSIHQRTRQARATCSRVGDRTWGRLRAAVRTARLLRSFVQPTESEHR
jgi:hypothetical protein